MGRFYYRSTMAKKIYKVDLDNEICGRLRQQWVGYRGKFLRMKILLQRASYASVIHGGKVYSEINDGLVIILGIGKDDTDPVESRKRAEYLCRKALNAKLWPDGGDDKENLYNAIDQSTWKTSVLDRKYGQEQTK